MEHVVAAFTALFVIIDPLALGPIFLSLTMGMVPARRRSIAFQAVAIGFAVLAGTALFGEWLLHQMGISLAAFRIAGGLLLFAVAFEMVFQRRVKRRAASVAAPLGETDLIAAFPLAVPLIAGPGAITATILLAGQAAWRPLALATLLLVIGLVLALCLTGFLLAPKIERFVGRMGQVVIGRLLGVILAALAVQFVVDGIAAMK